MTDIAMYENDYYRLRIVIDEVPEDPRRWDNLGTMVCWHRWYALGDERPERIDEYSSWDEWFEGEVGDPDDYVVLPLYLYDHGGITMNTRGFSCPWDSGQVGLIYCSKDRFRKETGYTEDELFGEEDRAAEMLRNEVEIYDQYLRGDVYGYILEKKHKCACCGNIEYEEIEAVYGFYGTDWRENGLLDHISQYGIVDELRI